MTRLHLQQTCYPYLTSDSSSKNQCNWNRVHCNCLNDFINILSLENPDRKHCQDGGIPGTHRIQFVCPKIWSLQNKSNNGQSRVKWRSVAKENLDQAVVSDGHFIQVHWFVSNVCQLYLIRIRDGQCKCIGKLTSSRNDCRTLHRRFKRSDRVSERGVYYDQTGSSPVLVTADSFSAWNTPLHAICSPYTACTSMYVQPHNLLAEI